jgi:hypothetical protein
VKRQEAGALLAYPSSLPPRSDAIFWVCNADCLSRENAAMNVPIESARLMMQCSIRRFVFSDRWLRLKNSTLRRTVIGQGAVFK